MRFEFATRCIVGQRSEQQDAVGVWTGADPPHMDEAVDGAAPALVIAVADGMGGQAAGSTASRIACATFMAAMASSSGQSAARLSEAVHEANEALGLAIAQDQALKTMGCTLAGVALGSGRLEWASLGDTHVFLVRDGRLLELNADQSGKPIVRKLVAAGAMSVGTAREHGENSRLYAALTGGKTGAMDRSYLPVVLRGGDIVIVASDGIDTLEHADILKLCGGDAGETTASIAERLLAGVEAANDEEQDNTTVCVVRVVEDGGALAEVPQGMSGDAGASAVAEQAA